MRTFFLTIAAAAAFGAALLAPGTAAADFGPTIHASLTGQGVWGGGFAPGAPVDVTVLAPDGSQLARAPASTDETGYFELRQDELETQLAPGLKVVVEAGSVSRDVTLTRLTFDLLDPGRDLATGTAPAGTDVVVYSWPGDLGVQLATTAVAGDTWRADFGARDLQVGGDAMAEVYEPDGDSTSAGRSAPNLKAVYHYEFQRRDVGIGGSAWTPGATLELEIVSADGDVLWSGSTVAEDDSFDYCCTREMLGLTFDITPGMRLRVTDTETEVWKELTLEPFTIDRVDPVEDAVYGTAPPDSEVWLNVGDVRRETRAGPDGAWRVQFVPADFRLGWQSTVEAGTNDFDGDWTGAMGQAPTISADLATDTINGTYLSLDGDLKVEALAADGTTAWSTTTSTGDTRALVVDAGVDLVPGMTVRVTDLATGVVKELELVPITVDVADPEHEHVAGTGVPGVMGHLFLWWPGLGGGEAGEVVPDAAGRWELQLPPGVDITPSTMVSFFVVDDEGDVTLTDYTAPVVAIPALEAQVTEAVPDGAAAAPLLTKLDGALASLGGSGGGGGGATAAVAGSGPVSGGHVNVGAAINKLGAFVNQVHAYVDSRRISPDAGACLAAEARRILVGLGG